MGPAPFPRSAADSEDVIAQFLRTKGWAHAKAEPMPGDFSSRLYRRLRRDAAAPEGSLLMRMGNPTELSPFILMRNLLAAASLRVPTIYAADEINGLAIVEDLGDARFDRLLETPGAPEKLYPIAVDVLVNLHKAAGRPDARTLGVPHFNSDLFMQQAALVLDVYGKILPDNFSEGARSSFMDVLKPVLEAACAAPHSLMLRDYHAANILYLPNEQGHKRAGVIDFQDGGVGPITYDLVSLLEDARRDVPTELRREMIDYYLSQCPVDENLFRASYPAMAAQRHIRVIAVTARRWLEKKDEAARDYLIRSWQMLYSHASEPALAPLFEWLDRFIPEKHRRAAR
jgi:aminoglycoside/choline kinase family phosphotransferase